MTLSLIGKHHGKCTMRQCQLKIQSQQKKKKHYNMQKMQNTKKEKPQQSIEGSQEILSRQGMVQVRSFEVGYTI